MYGPYHHGWMFEGGGMLIGGFWMLLMVVIPLLLIFALLKYLFAKSRDSSSRADKLPQAEKASPLDLLKEAYARGDISREVYLQKRDDLSEK